MIKKIAFRHILAKSMAEILAGTSRKVHEKAKELSVQNKGAGSFEVSGGKDTHTVKVQRQGVDVKVSCTCNAWVFQGSEYYAHKRDYLLGEPRGNLAPPRVRDPKGINVSCKHVVAVFKDIDKGVRLGRRENLLEHIPLCSNPEKWNDVVSLIEKDKTLDLTTEHEKMLSKEILKTDKNLHSFVYTHPLFDKRRKKLYVTLTEHAIVKAVARNIKATDIKKTLDSFFTLLMFDQKEMKKFFIDTFDNSNKIKITQNNITLILALNKADGFLKSNKSLTDAFRNTWRSNLEWSPEGLLYFPTGVHFRIRTVWGKGKSYSIGKPLETGAVDAFFNCPVERVDYTTHTEGKKDNPFYDYSARFAGMVQRISNKWLDR